MSLSLDWSCVGKAHCADRGGARRPPLREAGCADIHVVVYTYSM